MYVGCIRKMNGDSEIEKKRKKVSYGEILKKLKENDKDISEIAEEIVDSFLPENIQETSIELDKIQKTLTGLIRKVERLVDKLIKNGKYKKGCHDETFVTFSQNSLFDPDSQGTLSKYDLLVIQP